MASSIEVELGGRLVRVTSPDKPWFPARGLTKADAVEYLRVVSPGLLRAVRDRPTVMHRFPDGAGAADDASPEGFFQKRVGRAPDWIERVRVTFPAGGTADELCPTEPAQLLWALNLGCLEFHPWQVRSRDLLRPDELRFDLDPSPGVGFDAVREVAFCLREVLAEVGMVGFPKTSGSRGLHVLVRIQPRWGYLPVRRCVLAVAREVERRVPRLATTAWWKEERGPRVFIDYNQNLPDRTVVAAYSIRPRPDATVSCPLDWDELATIGGPAAFTVESVPARFGERGDPMAGLDEQAHSLEPVFEWVARDERAGAGEAPFPPHFPKVPGEPPRVSPTRARRSPPGEGPRGRSEPG